MWHHHERLWESGFCPECKPLLPERAGPELQSPRRERSQDTPGKKGRSKLGTEDTQVREQIHFSWVRHLLLDYRLGQDLGICSLGFRYLFFSKCRLSIKANCWIHFVSTLLYFIYTLLCSNVVICRPTISTCAPDKIADSPITNHTNHCLVCRCSWGHRCHNNDIKPTPSHNSNIKHTLPHITCVLLCLPVHLSSRLPFCIICSRRSFKLMDHEFSRCSFPLTAEFISHHILSRQGLTEQGKRCEKRLQVIGAGLSSVGSDRGQQIVHKTSYLGLMWWR